MGPEEKAVIGVLGEEEEVKGPRKGPRAEAKLQRANISPLCDKQHIHG